MRILIKLTGLLCGYGFILAVLGGENEIKKDDIESRNKYKSSGKFLLPDLNRPIKAATEEGYYSKEHRAIRMGKGFFEREKEKYANVEEAIQEARKVLTVRTKKWSAEARERMKSSGLKMKDYHKPGYTLKKGRVKRLQNKILREDNGIHDPEIAKEMALKEYKKINRGYGRKSRAKRAAIKKEGSSSKPE